MSQELKAVVQAVVKLTTQVKRIADVLAAPQTMGYQPVGYVPEPTTGPTSDDDDAAQTTGVPPCTCPDGFPKAQHPEPCPLSSEPYATELARIHGTPVTPTPVSETTTGDNAPSLTDVQGRCPACGHEGLFLGEGGYLTCPRDTCPEPDAASTLLEQPTKL